MCKLLSVRPLAKIPFVGLLICGGALGQAAPAASAPISPIAQRMDMVAAPHVNADDRTAGVSDDS